jgi:hypothetical protein
MYMNSIQMEGPKAVRALPKKLNAGIVMWI